LQTFSSSSFSFCLEILNIQVAQQLPSREEISNFINKGIPKISDIPGIDSFTWDTQVVASSLVLICFSAFF